jgi:hypothetical protein
MVAKGKRVRTCRRLHWYAGKGSRLPIVTKIGDKVLTITRGNAQIPFLGARASPHGINGMAGLLFAVLHDGHRLPDEPFPQGAS